MPLGDPGYEYENVNPHPRRVAVKRGYWAGCHEFLLVAVGFVLDLGNFWRFPYVMYKNGGGKWTTSDGFHMLNLRDS